MSGDDVDYALDGDYALDDALARAHEADVQTLASWSAAIKPELDRQREEWNNLPPGPISQIKLRSDSSSKPAPIPHGEPQNRVPDEVQKKGKSAG